MPEITARIPGAPGQAIPASRPIVPGPKSVRPVSTAPLLPAANNSTNGQPDKGVATATSPPAADQPGSAGADQEAQRLQRLSDEQARQRARQRQAQERKLVDETRSREVADLEDLRTKVADRELVINRFKTDPYGVLLDMGVTADEAAAILLQQPEVGAQKLTLAQRQLDEALKRIEQLEQGTEKSAAQSREAAKSQIRHDTRMAIKADPSLEAMKHYGDAAVEAVVQLIERIYDDPQGGYVLDTAEAIADVEEYLVEQSLAAANLPKVRAKLTPAEVAAAVEAGAEAQGAAQTKTKPPIKTLSTGMVPTGSKDEWDKLTARERAIRVASGQQRPA